MTSEKNKNIILNQEEEGLLLDHNYDGIEEFDYPLPSWWVWTFVGGIVFALFYFILYQVMKAPDLRAEFNSKWKEVVVSRAENAKKGVVFIPSEYQKWLEVNKGGVKKSLEVYNEYCLSCHEKGGKGDIGPNLTDAYWIHLKEITPEKMYKFVYEGFEDNGMPAWGEMLTKEEIFAAILYLDNIKFTNVPGKGPQGDEVRQ